MTILQGKGIWTLYDDIDRAVEMAPQVGADFILSKVSNRGKWSDTLAQKALAAVHRNGDLIPVAWTYPYFESVDAEVECLRKAFASGFAAYIIDAEHDTNMKFAQAEEFAKKVAALGVDLSRIYLCTDPRLNPKINEIPMRQLSTICKGGMIPMIYGEILPNDRENAAARLTARSYGDYEKYKAELGYSNIPLMPAFASYWDNQGHSRMNYVEMKKWCDQFENKQAPFVSLYRGGVTTSEAMRAFKEMKVAEPAAISVVDTMILEPAAQPAIGEAPAPMPSIVVRERCIVEPDSYGYAEGFYPPAQPGGWSAMQDKSGHKTKYRWSSPTQTMYATYSPVITTKGMYVVEAFVPGTHATTRGARYFVTHHAGGQEQNKESIIDQRQYSDVWVPLGVFELDPAFESTGRVNMIDQTSDKEPRELAFTAIRWRTAPDGIGYDSPVGSVEERAGAALWPGRWKDANPYLSKYSLGYHTGADLNLNYPTHDLDRHAPVYSISDGVVTFAKEVGGAWQAVVVVEHEPLPDGTPVYSRYGHVDNIIVKAGDRVTRGQQLAVVGQSGGAGANYHLHFDISCTKIMKTNPQHWPGSNFDETKKHYVDPLKFIQANRPK